MHTEPQKCFVCASDSAKRVISDFDGYHLFCDRCGEYRISGSVYNRVCGLGIDDRERIFGWLAEQSSLRTETELHAGNLNFILSRPRLGFAEVVDRFLLEADRINPRFGAVIEISDRRLRRSCGILHIQSYKYVVDQVENMGLISKYHDNKHFVILPKRLEYISGIAHRKINSSQAFVAMWFSEEMNNAWENGFFKAVYDAGYKPFRIDVKEHINKICDEIVAEIRRSRFLVADYTGGRGGVYYESGYASGLGIPVINTCRHDHMDDLHFDIRQYNCISWKNDADLYRRLKVRIEAIIGDGPAKIPASI